MERRNSWVWLVAAGVLVAACGGGEEPPPPGTPAQQPSEGEGAPDTGVEQAAGPQLMREVFTYRGAGRDPFLSLVKTGDVRPVLTDLRVTSITYDERYPTNSVAVLRDTSQACVQSPTERCRYTVQAGDMLGRLTIAQIRRHEVVVVYEEFGEERRQILRLRRGQEGIR
ncbi:MAG: hypothetical protein ACE5PT_09205 [Gemmatimonadales bacterium]